MRWQYEMTREAVPGLQQRYEWALQRQNARFEARLPMRRRQRIVGLLAGTALLLILVVYLLDPRGAARHPLLFVGAPMVFSAFLIAALFMPRIHAWSRRSAGGMLERAAERVYRRIAARAPYTIDYELDAETLHARVVALRIDRRFELRRARLVLHAPGVVFLFRSRGAFNPHAFAYTPSDAEHTAVLAAVAQHGAEVEALTGPVEGYRAPIPEARVR